VLFLASVTPTGYEKYRDIFLQDAAAPTLRLGFGYSVGALNTTLTSADFKYEIAKTHNSQFLLFLIVRVHVATPQTALPNLVVRVPMSGVHIRLPVKEQISASSNAATRTMTLDDAHVDALTTDVVSVPAESVTFNFDPFNPRPPPPSTDFLYAVGFAFSPGDDWTSFAKRRVRFDWETMAYSFGVPVEGPLELCSCEVSDVVSVAMQEREAGVYDFSLSSQKPQVGSFELRSPIRDLIRLVANWFMVIFGGLLALLVTKLAVRHVGILYHDSTAGVRDALPGRRTGYDADATGSAPLNPDASFEDRLLAAARSRHQWIGPRQLEVLRHLAETWPEGLTTGALSRKTRSDRANTYATLRSMTAPNMKLIRKDDSRTPHRYYLADAVATEAKGVTEGGDGISPATGV
jgi:hypothetical protein